MSVDALANGALGVVGVGLIVAGLGVVLLNYRYLILNRLYRRRRETLRHSLIPLNGPILMTMGLLGVTTIPGTLSWYLLAAWAVDPATWITAYSALKTVRSRT